MRSPRQCRCTYLDLRAVLPRADDPLPLPVEAPSGEATGRPQGEGNSLQGRRRHCRWPRRLAALPKAERTCCAGRITRVEGRRKRRQLPAAPLPRSEYLGKPRHWQLQQPLWNWLLLPAAQLPPLVGEVWLDTAMPLPSQQETEEDLRTRFSSSTAWYVILAVARRPL